MYIPKELIFYILGFASFPVLCYLVYVIKYKDKENKDDRNT